MGKGKRTRTKNEKEEDATFTQALLYLREIHGWQGLSYVPVVRVSWEVVAEEALEPSILRLLDQDLNSEMKQGD